MIAFLSLFYPLLDRPTRRRSWFAASGLVGLAGLEALALVALVPLMQILTAPDLHSTSASVQAASDLFGDPSPESLAIALGAIVLGIYVVKAVAGILLLRWTTTFALSQETRIVHRLMSGYLHAPYKMHLERSSAEFVRTLTVSCSQVFRTGFVQALSALGDILSVVFIGLVLAITNPVIAIVAGAYFACVTLVYQRVSHRVIGRAAEQIHKEQAVDFGTIQQALTAVKEVKVRGAEDYFADEVRELRTGLVPAFRTMTLIGVTPRYVLELAMVGAAAIIAVVAFSTESVAVATATLAVFLAGGFRVLGPLNKVIFGVAQARAAIPAVEQMRSDLATVAVDDEAHDGPENEQLLLRPCITVDEVSFAYVPGIPVLSGVSFEILQGESVGLVGGSGAGKSTLLDLLLGLLTPDAGEISIDDWPIQTVRRHWQHMIGYVPQSIALFDDTVAANVALGIPPGEVDEGQLWHALAVAQLDDVVRGLSGGVHHMIGESGVQLSGGQRQRLGVARAMYHDPKVLMFDEATSALDNETEFKLTEVLDEFRGQLTTITIAHRLSTVRRCDRLLYLEQGRLVAHGSFSEISESIPGFARMVELSTVRA